MPKMWGIMTDVSRTCVYCIDTHELRTRHRVTGLFRRRMYRFGGGSSGCCSLSSECRSWSADKSIFSMLEIHFPTSELRQYRAMKYALFFACAELSVTARGTRTSSQCEGFSISISRCLEGVRPKGNRISRSEVEQRVCICMGTVWGSKRERQLVRLSCKLEIGLLQQIHL